jgi:plasmid stabilization system protein ParE
MPAEVRWTIRGRRELTRALNWIGRHHPDGVEAVATAVQSQLERLRWTPYLSAVFQRTARGEVRETLAASYRIFYRVQHGGTVVLILSVRHVRRKDPNFSR